MGLSIKNAETERLVRQLVERTGESVTGAISEAVRQRLERLATEDQRSAKDKLDTLEKISAECASRWVEPFRSVDHGDLLYDDLGLPK